MSLRARLVIALAGLAVLATAVVAGLCLGAIVFVVVRDGHRAVEAPATAAATTTAPPAATSDQPAYPPGERPTQLH